MSASVKVAGDNFNQAIMRYVREKHSLFIGEDTAEKIKIQIGTACEEADPRTMEVKGRNVITGLPNGYLTSEEIRVALKDATGQIGGRQFTEFWRKHRRNWQRYCGQRNCPYRWWCSASWNGYIDRTENRSQYADCSGRNAGSGCGNRKICRCNGENGRKTEEALPLEDLSLITGAKK